MVDILTSIPFELLNDKCIPARQKDNDAGFDLRASKQCKIHRGETQIVPCGIKIAIPNGFIGIIVGRSGLASKGIICHTGIIDPNYRGEVGAILNNFSHITQNVKNYIDIEVGDRIAQLIVVRNSAMSMFNIYKLSETERGEAGFGSSGVK